MKLVELPYIYSTLAFVLSIVMVIIALYYLVYKNKVVMKNKIATTIEQSKKLIELGLNDSTADMYYPSDESAYPKLGVSLMLSANIPAWSLSALYDILPSTIEGKYDLHTYKYDIDGHSYQSVMYIDLVNSEDYCMFDEEGVFDAVFKMVCWLLEHGYINKDIKL